jgi:hypothetical protein
MAARWCGVPSREGRRGAFIVELRGGWVFSCTPRRGGSSTERGVGGGAAATCVGAGQYGGAATGRAARQGHVTSAGRVSRAMLRKWEGSTARGPVDRGRSRHAGPARPCRGDGDAGAGARSGAPESNLIQPACFDRDFSPKI